MNTLLSRLSDFALLNQGKEMYEHNALGYRSGLALCLSKVRSSRARCPATALIFFLQRVLILTTTYHKTFIVHTH